MILVSTVHVNAANLFLFISLLAILIEWELEHGQFCYLRIYIMYF